MPGVAVVGSLSLDTILTKDRSILKLGGAVTYSGLTFSRLDVPTTVVFNLAEAEQPVCHLFETEAVRVIVGRTETTTRFVNDTRGKVRRQSAPALAEPIRAEDVYRVANQVSHVHLGPLHWHDIDTRVFESSYLGRLTVSTDIQGFTRRPENGEIATEISPQLADALRASSYVKASRRELERITSDFGLSPSEIVRSFELQELVITEDRTGGIVISNSGEEIRYGAETDELEVVDTTGAGDVFFAAYLVHRLHRGDGIAASAKQAAEVASLQVADHYIAEESLSLDRYLPSSRHGRAPGAGAKEAGLT